MNNPMWYTIDENLATCTRHTVNLDEALALVKRYVYSVQSSYETIEEFLAANLFGFCRSTDEFIEICVHSSGEISVRFELPRPKMPWIIRLLVGPFQHEETVRSLDALHERVREFFTMSPGELREKLKQFS